MNQVIKRSNPVAVALVKGTTSTYTTTVSSAHSIDGKRGTVLTAQTNAATPTTDAKTGRAFTTLTDNQANVYVFGITVGGAIAVCEGGVQDTEVGVTTVAGAFKNRPQFPDLPDDFAAIGYLFVRTAPSAASWTFGVDSWTATGITASAVVELDGDLPVRPQALP